VATEFTYTDPADLQPGQSAPFDMIILDDASANIASGSLNVQSSEYAMILPAVVFAMNGQTDGDSLGDFGSLGGGPINAPPEEEPPEEEPPEEEPPEEEPPEEEPPEEEPPEEEPPEEEPPEEEENEDEDEDNNLFG
jgi:outer membrane biosynthesis protein TonB